MLPLDKTVGSPVANRCMLPPFTAHCTIGVESSQVTFRGASRRAVGIGASCRSPSCLSRTPVDAEAPVGADGLGGEVAEFGPIHCPVHDVGDVIERGMLLPLIPLHPPRVLAVEVATLSVIGDTQLRTFWIVGVAVLPLDVVGGGRPPLLVGRQPPAGKLGSNLGGDVVDPPEELSTSWMHVMHGCHHPLRRWASTLASSSLRACISSSSRHTP